jgi:cell division cycle protein 37
MVRYIGIIFLLNYYADNRPRWMQRKIREEREERKLKIAHLNAQIACNEVILPRIQSIYSDITSGNPENKPQPYFNALMSRLTNSPSPDCPPGNDPSKLEQTYDGMVLDLLRQVSSKAREEVGSNASLTTEEKEEKMEKFLVEGVGFHVGKLKETIEEDKDKLEYELKEQKKHITSDDLHDGFSSKVRYLSKLPLSLFSYTFIVCTCEGNTH